VKLVILGLGLLLVLPVPVSGQIIRGRIVDAATSTPIPGARVTLRRTSDSSALTITSGDDGSFALGAPGAGDYMIDVVRLGFGPAHHGPVSLRNKQVVTVEVSLQQIPYALDSVTVFGDANAAMLDRVGWYVRQRSDFGRFIARREIESHHVGRVTDLLTTVPGVSLVADPKHPGHVRVRMRGSQVAMGGLCEPRVFLDGLIVIRGGSGPIGGRTNTDQSTEAEDPFNDPRSPELALDDVVGPLDIEAMEIYRSASQVPAEFGGTGVFTRCGVVVIWTRRGR